MASVCAASNFAGFFHAASLANLEQKRMITVHGADRSVLLCWHEGQVFALDNRCPHMGFPLSKGSLDRGLLTCPWHHARFDLRSGCTFDLWADDTPMFEVCVEGDDIWVSKVPVQRADAVFHSARLRRGLEENIGLVQAKSIVALLSEGEGAKNVLREIAKFGARHHRVWGDGMTMLSLVARLRPCLGETTLVYALAAAARTVSENCAGQPMRHSPGRLNGEGYDQERLSEWMFHWAKVRHDEAAERTLLTALGCGLTREGLNRIVFGPIQERIYADRGHALDLSNKAFELLEFIGWEYATEVLPLIVEHLTQSRSEEEQGTWRAPIDLVELIQSAEEALRQNPPRTREGVVCEPDFYSQVLGEHPQAIIRAVAEAVNHGAPPVEVARHLTLAAAWRLARFPQSNAIEDWFAPVHTFSFCNALHRVLARGETGSELVCGLFHAAMSIYVDRFLNIPAAQLPSEQPLETLPIAADELRETILSALDQRKEWSEVPRLVLRYLRLGHPEPQLIDTLTFATVREDLDFHTLQVLEAAFTQAEEWPPASAERELLYAAVCRHLAAHCPTRRSSSQSVAVALRLQKGEEVYAE
ncbi:MAG: Rieske 2Fe-2S domain-containing protein [Terrimicrobiaceae bacterium]